MSFDPLMGNFAKYREHQLMLDESNIDLNVYIHVYVYFKYVENTPLLSYICTGSHTSLWYLQLGQKLYTLQKHIFKTPIVDFPGAAISVWNQSSIPCIGQSDQSPYCGSKSVRNYINNSQRALAYLRFLYGIIVYSGIT